MVEILTLVCSLIICIAIPVIIFMVLAIKNRDERKGIILLFVLGALFYAGMQWGIKQNGLQYLFNHTDFITFMSSHYIAYLFVVALFGAIFAVIPEVITVMLFKRQITFKQAIAMGLGYTVSETGFLIGYPGVRTILEYTNNKDSKLNTTVGELLMSGYERILLTVIGIALIVVLIYFIEQKMTIRGVIIKVLCQAVIAFMPGFLIAFSTKDMLEVFDRSTSLIMVYVLMTAAAFSAVAVLNGLKWKMYEK